MPAPEPAVPNPGPHVRTSAETVAHADSGPGSPASPTAAKRPRVDTSRAHSARVYDYWLGGKDHYPVDERLGELMPDAKRVARDNRAFMQRAVSRVAGTGVDQFLDIGTGIPTEPNLHQVVQGINPACRVVYADNDPIVLRHAEALLVSSPEGATDYVEADVREPETILEHARRTLDLDRPVCLSLVALLHFVTDEERPYDIVRTLVGGLVPGSCLVLSHGTYDFTPGFADAPTPEERHKVETYTSQITVRFRDHDEVLGFFDGLELLEPGLVATAQWRTDGAQVETPPSALYAAVARVP